jgi:hypothetical protein
MIYNSVCSVSHSQGNQISKQKFIEQKYKNILIISSERQKKINKFHPQGAAVIIQDELHPGFQPGTGDIIVVKEIIH